MLHDDDFNFLIKMLNDFKSELHELAALIRYVLKYPSQLSFGDFMYEPEVLKLLRMNSFTLRKIRRSGELPFFRVKRRILYRASDVHNYILKSRCIDFDPSNTMPQTPCNSS